MDFAALFVALLLGVGIPLRNKAIKEYRKKGTKTPILKNKRGINTKIFYSIIQHSVL